VEDMASSPRAKSETKRNQGRRAAWRGGRLGLWLEHGLLGMMVTAICGAI
jgi:hypothetical protein